MIHHLLSHSDTADWLKVNQFFVEQLAYIAAQARRDPGRRADGARQLDAPVLLQHADRQPRRHASCRSSSSAAAAGKIQGRPRARLPRQDPNRKMCSLYLSMMDKVGVHLNDSATRPSRWRKCKRGSFTIRCLNANGSHRAGSRVLASGSQRPHGGFHLSRFTIA